MSKASERAYQKIRAMMLSGELEPGAQLREEYLAERCGVSRTPVREALNRLESEMFVVRSESQRTFVAQWSLSDAEDAFDLRAMLEAHAARRAAIRMDAAQYRRMKGHNDALGEAIRKTPPDVPSFLEHNRAFHEIIIEAADSPRLAAMLATVTEQPVVFRTALHYDQGSLNRSHAEHEDLLSAFEKGDAAWAGSIMAGHIQRAFHAYSEARSQDKAA